MRSDETDPSARANGAPGRKLHDTAAIKQRERIAIAASEIAIQLYQQRLLAFEPITECDRFKFDPDCVVDRNDRPRLEYEGGQHRTEFVNRCRFIAVNQHVSAPIADADYEHLDLEIPGCLPLREDL